MAHWHHTCWNCGRDLCGGPVALPVTYACRCGCQENSSLAFIRTDESFDREFAAVAPCP